MNIHAKINMVSLLNMFPFFRFPFFRVPFFRFPFFRFPSILTHPVRPVYPNAYATDYTTDLLLKTGKYDHGRKQIARQHSSQNSELSRSTPHNDKYSESA